MYPEKIAADILMRKSKIEELRGHKVVPFENTCQQISTYQEIWWDEKVNWNNKCMEMCFKASWIFFKHEKNIYIKKYKL